MTSLQPLADAKGLTLTGDIPDTSFMVYSDTRALGQILINLVNNAIKFTDAGTVTVSLHRDNQGKRCITVSDTGPGIAPQDLDRIFRAFERGLVASAGQHEGTGLGLHICQKLAELMRARIVVDTSLEVGSSFSVVFDEEAIRPNRYESSSSTTMRLSAAVSPTCSAARAISTSSVRPARWQRRSRESSLPRLTSPCSTRDCRTAAASRCAGSYGRRSPRSAASSSRPTTTTRRSSPRCSPGRPATCSSRFVARTWSTRYGRLPPAVRCSTRA